nr:hypothetical protein L203_06453 [Cryptococcus depauperatus CBS 7841]
MYCREWGPARFQQYKIKTNLSGHDKSPPSNLEDIFTARPVLHDQLLDTSELLGEDCGFVGVERDDGKEEGDYRMMLMIRSSLTWVKRVVGGDKDGWNGRRSDLRAVRAAMSKQLT